MGNEKPAPTVVPRPEPGAHAKTLNMDAVPENDTGPISEKQIRVKAPDTLKSAATEGGHEQKASSPEQSTESVQAAKREKFQRAHDVLKEIEEDARAEQQAKLAEVYKDLGITGEDVEAAIDQIAPGEKKVSDDFSAFKGREITKGAFEAGAGNVVFETRNAAEEVAKNLIKGKGVTSWDQALAKLKGAGDETFYNEVAAVVRKARPNMIAQPRFLKQVGEMLEGQVSPAGVEALKDAIREKMAGNPMLSPEDALEALDRTELKEEVAAYKANLKKSRDRQSAA